MLKFSHATLTYASGVIWLCVGVFLLQLGLSLLMTAVEQGYHPLLRFLQGPLGGQQEAAIAIIAVALYLGILKGKHVLAKTAHRVVANIRKQPNPTAIQNAYGVRYCLLLAIMVALGISIKYFGIPNDIRGAIDTTIGVALIHGSLSYFRMARVDSVKTSA